MENDDEPILPMLLDFYERKVREKHARGMVMNDFEVMTFGILLLAYFADREQSLLYQINQKLEKAVEG